MIARALLLVVALATPTLSIAGERYDFVLHCAGCHKPDGSGSEVVPSLDETGMIFALPGGREYLASVPGVAQAPLDDARLAALLTWMLGEFGKVDATPPYDADEVRRLRTNPLRDPVAAREQILGSATADER